MQITPYWISLASTAIALCIAGTILFALRRTARQLLLPHLRAEWEIGVPREGRISVTVRILNRLNENIVVERISASSAFVAEGELGEAGHDTAGCPASKMKANSSRPCNWTIVATGSSTRRFVINDRPRGNWIEFFVSSSHGTLKSSRLRVHHCDDLWSVIHKVD